MKTTKMTRLFLLALSLTCLLGEILPAVAVSTSTQVLSVSSPNLSLLTRRTRNRWRPVLSGTVRQTSGRSQTGGVRGITCLKNNSALVPITLPYLEKVNTPSASAKYTLNFDNQQTGQPYPTIFFYLAPRKDKTSLEGVRVRIFDITNYEGNDLYEPVRDNRIGGTYEFNLPSGLVNNPQKSGIVGIRLTDLTQEDVSFKGLENGHKYKWEIELSCSGTSAQDTLVYPQGAGYFVMDASLTPTTLERMQSFNLSEQNIPDWYYLSASVARSIFDHPENTEDREYWQEMLKSTKLTELTEEPTTVTHDDGTTTSERIIPVPPDETDFQGYATFIGEEK